jgi:HEAT repeat protein
MSELHFNAAALERFLLCALCALLTAASPWVLAQQTQAPQLPTVSSAVDGKTADLVAGLGSDSSDERKQAREALLALGPEALAALLQRIEDPEFRVRWEVVNTLGYLGEAQAMLPLVDRVVFDPNPHVRWRSMWALAALQHDDAVTAELLQRMTDDSQRWNAAVGLSMFARPQAIPVLLEGLNSDDSWILFEAVFCLGRSFDENTSKALVALLDHPETKTRQDVVMSLGKIGDATAVGGLVRALGDPEAGVRWRAAMNLQRAHDPGVAPFLAAALENESDEMVIGYLHEALAALEKVSENGARK